MKQTDNSLLCSFFIIFPYSNLFDCVALARLWENGQCEGMKAYQLHDVLIATARPKAELWRLAVAIVLIVAGFFALNLVYYQTLASLPSWGELRSELLDGRSARAIWAMLGNFVPLLIVVLVVARLLNGRSLIMLTGPKEIVFHDFLRVGWLGLALFLLVSLLPSPGGVVPVRNMMWGAWFGLLPVSLMLIFVQVSTEEILFRGYLQSQIAARFSSPLAWMVIPSVLFGALHYEPSTYGENAIWLAVWSGFFGLAVADLTARSGNLGPALALHFLNNISAMMFTAMQGHWDGLALYVYPFGPEDIEALKALLPIEGLVILCGWLVARVAIRR